MRAPISPFVDSADGVRIAYAAQGAGMPALVFVHGGLAHRGFWHRQLTAFAASHRVVTVDLAGHGESGRARARWTIPMFANDVRAVVEQLALPRVVLIGSSLGGPVSLETAALLRGRVIGVVGVDTFHDLAPSPDPDGERARVEAFRRDPEVTRRAMVDMLFHPGAYPDLQAWAVTEMSATPPEVVVAMLSEFIGYDLAAACRAAGVPIRAINGDLWPTDTEKNRGVVRDFDAAVMPNTGHYPMLEQPGEFNRLLQQVVADLDRSSAAMWR